MATRGLDARVRRAVKYFWEARAGQADRQRSAEAATRGERSAVLAGGHMDDLAQLVSELLVETDLPKDSIHYSRSADIPGFFRATKQWDLLVVYDGALLAAIEFKSQVGPSFGNNINNRAEEALGNSTDLHTAYREGAFSPSPQPWLGYVMLVERAPESTRPVRVKEPHFPAFPEFHDASYIGRYELLCLRIVRERLYDAAAFLTSERESGMEGAYDEPAAELSMARFTQSLIGHVRGFLD